MKPTIGRIVLYKLPEHYWQYVAEDDRVRPAIVTRVHNEGRAINVRVIYDPTDVFMVSVADQTFLIEGLSWSWPSRS